jgi:hypothetical protein
MEGEDSMRKHDRSTASLFIAAVLAVIPSGALAYGTGYPGLTIKPGNTSTGCGGCHGSAVDMAITVSISGPTALDAGQSATYTVTAGKPGVTNGTKMGIDVATSDPSGALSNAPSMPTRVNLSINGTGDIVHTTAAGALRTTSAGTADYQFVYTMPAGAAGGSTHSLYAVAALTVSTNGTFNHAPVFVVTTRPAAPTSATASGPTTSSINLAWSGGGPNYRVVYRLGATAPANESDGTFLDLGAVTSATISGLLPSSQYSFAVFSKVSGQSLFSTSGATATATTSAAPAATRYVNVATGSDAGNNCATPATPCKTITNAMAQASPGNPGDTVTVAAGTYGIATGEVFPITMKIGTSLVSSGTPETTIIDAAGDTAKQGILVSNTGLSTMKIEGFTFRNGLSQTGHGATIAANGGAIFIGNFSGLFRVTRNIFSANEARGSSANCSSTQAGQAATGGAVYVHSSSNVIIYNNSFVSNVARGGDGCDHPGTPLNNAEFGGDATGGAVYLNSVQGSFTENTFYGNQALGGRGGNNSGGTTQPGAGKGGAMGGGGTNGPSFWNNLFALNSAVRGTGTLAQFWVDGSKAGAMYSDAATGSVLNNLFYLNTVNGGTSTGDLIGTGSVSADPQFHNPLSTPPNLRIRVGSPAAGAGTISGTPVDLTNAPRPTNPSIGAFEPSVLATLTSVNSNGNPARVGDVITLSASIFATNATVSGGTVTFKDGSTPICSAVAVSSGGAQCITSALAAGTHSITAEYSGSATYAASASSALNQVVSPAGTSGLIVSTVGNGTVVSSPSGINCGATCSASFTTGSTVTLVATPAAGSSFTGWGGACYQATTGTCQFVINFGEVVVANFAASSTPARLGNISTRGQVLTGNDVMIGGFVIGGTAAKTVLVRARGPSMIPAGVTNAILDPTMTLVNQATGTIIATNDNWTSASNASAITATGLAPTDTRESAILMSVAPGAYTAVVSGVNNAIGVGIVEVFEIDGPQIPLSNISTRGQVQTGNNVMIGGFVISGSAPQQVLIRARGPSMIPAGVTNAIADPTMTLVNQATNAIIATNDNWGSASNAAAIMATGLAPTNALESAILTTLQPGAYTVVVSGVNNVTGVGIVEVFAQ